MPGCGRHSPGPPALNPTKAQSCGHVSALPKPLQTAEARPTAAPPEGPRRSAAASPSLGLDPVAFHARAPKLRGCLAPAAAVWSGAWRRCRGRRAPARAPWTPAALRLCLAAQGGVQRCPHRILLGTHAGPRLPRAGRFPSLQQRLAQHRPPFRLSLTGLGIRQVSLLIMSPAEA